MVYSIDFFFLIIFFLQTLYSLVDRFCLYTRNGSKLSKYIDSMDPQSMTGNFVVPGNNYFIKKMFSIFKSPINYRQALKSLLVSIVLLIVKIAFTYDFLKSNFLYINLFSKNIDIASVFENKYIFLKIFYYFLSFYFYYYIIYKIFKKYDNFKLVSKKKVVDCDNIQISIGKNNDLSEVKISEKGLYQNILITGSIGSGKTSSAINTLLYGFLKNKIYGLIIDIKGNYVETVEKISRKFDLGDKVKVISLNSSYKYNPLNTKLSNYELASRMKKVLTLISDNNISDSFWLDKAESYIRDFITLIKAYNSYINFEELHKLVINKEYLIDKINTVKENVLNNIYSNDELYNINIMISNLKNEYLTLDERTLGIIKAEITRMTNVFVSDYSINKQFGSDSEIIDFSNYIIVLSIDIGQNKFLSKIISTYLKLEFQAQVLSNSFKSKALFFICDEYQEIVNIEDSNFFSLSREFKCINVISMQSYSSLFNNLPKESSGKVIIQNFVNKIWFRNDDNYTVSEIIKQIGKEEKKIKNISIGESSQNTKYNILTKNFKDYKSGLSKNYSINYKNEYIFNEEYFTRHLKTFQAVCLLSDGNEVNLYDKVTLERLEC